MRRALIVAVAVVVVGGLGVIAAILVLGGPPAAATCPLKFSEFAVASRDGTVSVNGRVIDARGAPFTGPVQVNLTFMTPGCGILPFSAATDRQGRFNADSPPPKERTCIAQGGTATARASGGCEIEGVTQGSW